MREIFDQTEFRRLPLRALVACVLRCATRVQPLIQERFLEDAGANDVSVARVNNVVLLLCQTFCREGLNAESRLADFAEELKWKESQQAATDEDTALAAGNAAFLAATWASFGIPSVPGVASSSTAETTREQATIGINHA